MERIIITGASDGLGLETAKIFSAKGYQVISISRTKPGIDIEHIKTDLGKEEEIKNAIDVIKNKYSNFTYLINCAGVFSLEKLNSLTSKEIEKTIKVNTIAPMLITSGLMDLIKINNADIVNVGSTLSFKAYESQASYGVSKWALRGYTENLQLELKSTPIRVIGFYPGGFATKFTEKVTGIKDNPAGWMEPKDLAKLLVTIVELPKNMEVSQIIINRKSNR